MSINPRLFRVALAGLKQHGFTPLPDTTQREVVLRPQAYHWTLAELGYPLRRKLERHPHRLVDSTAKGANRETVVVAEAGSVPLLEEEMARLVTLYHRLSEQVFERIKTFGQSSLPEPIGLPRAGRAGRLQLDPGTPYTLFDVLEPEHAYELCDYIGNTDLVVATLTTHDDEAKNAADGANSILVLVPRRLLDNEDALREFIESALDANDEGETPTTPDKEDAHATRL